MFVKHPLFKGTIILTLSGILSRFMGFFYRVFLSRAIGAEGMGLYQLVFPVYILASSITVSGIQTAISRLVSARTASVSSESGKTILLTGILISAGLSIPVSALLFFLASPIAIWYLKSPAATDLLRLVALAIPFGAFHACADGYYLGIRNTVVPAIRQLLEQAVRFLLLLPLYYGFFPHSVPLTPLIAVLILVLEECAAALFSFFTLFFSLSRPGNTLFLQKIRLFLQYHHTVLYSDSAELLSVALPLTGNRVVVCLLQSLEASLLPVRLCCYGYTAAQALRIYGILTGMSLPMILFPTAVTSALCAMLLPSVSAAWASGFIVTVHRLIQKSILSCLSIGLVFSLSFLLLGKPVTVLLFQNELAGCYVQAFAFVCPLLYLNPVLFSILNGLGKSSAVFFYSLGSLVLRLVFLFFVVPFWGITGYFMGLFLSQLLCCFLSLRSLGKQCRLRKKNTPV